MVRTNDGGTHETGLRSALTRVFNEYARKYNFLKEKDKNLEGNDVREGLTAILSIKVPEHLLQFEGQTKGKLGTPIARNAVDAVVGEKLSYFLEENKTIADTLVRKMIRASQAREAARKAREQSRKGKGARQEKILSGKLHNLKIARKTNFILSKVILPEDQLNREGTENIKRFYLYVEKSSIPKKPAYRTL